MPRDNGVVMLPVIDRQDIRSPVSVNGKARRSRIVKVTLDDYGSLWQAITSGLYRYDGNTLKHYLHEPGNPAILSADRLSTVYSDPDGLWSEDGLNLAKASGGKDGRWRYGQSATRKLPRRRKIA